MKKFVMAALVLAAVAAPATGEEPPVLETVIALNPRDGRAVDASFADESRRRAMETAAIAYGAQAGLARRGWEISLVLTRHAPQLSRIYRFRDLMIEAAGFLVQPPVLAETRDAFVLARAQDRAAIAARVVTIVAREKIVSAVPSWRDFLAREWPAPAAPATVLFPRTVEEKAQWRAWVTQGWASGARLADEIFEDDLVRLNAIFTGIILWHHLHLAGMVTEPAVATREVAVAGGGATLRIAERFAALDAAATLVADPHEWRALVRQP